LPMWFLLLSSFSRRSFSIGRTRRPRKTQGDGLFGNSL